MERSERSGNEFQGSRAWCLVRRCLPAVILALRFQVRHLCVLQEGRPVACLRADAADLPKGALLPQPGKEVRNDPHISVGGSERPQAPVNTVQLPMSGIRRLYYFWFAC